LETGEEVALLLLVAEGGGRGFRVACKEGRWWLGA
jgi:hypothetical protein